MSLCIQIDLKVSIFLQISAVSEKKKEHPKNGLKN